MPQVKTYPTFEEADKKARKIVSNDPCLYAQVVFCQGEGYVIKVWDTTDPDNEEYLGFYSED